MRSVRPLNLTTDTNLDVIRCNTRLTALQFAGMFAPSPGSLIFGVFFCFVWITAVPASTIATILLVGFASIFALKGIVFSAIFVLNPWQVQFKSGCVEFLQGGRLVATLKLRCKDAETVSIIENRLFPRMLRITKSDGTNLDTLYGVSRSDLETVAAQIVDRNAKCRI